MKKSMLIVSAGPGLSQSVAEVFGKQGYRINLIGNNEEILDKVKQNLIAKGITVETSMADANDATSITTAIEVLRSKSGNFDIVHYNAAVLKSKDILEESSESLAHEFIVNVGNALHTFKTVLADLTLNKGTYLLTGGGLGIHPSPMYGSLSIGKAGLRNLAYQLQERVKDDNIHIGLVTIDGVIDPLSKTHSAPVLADLFWQLFKNRSIIEIHQSPKGTELINI